MRRLIRALAVGIPAHDELDGIEQCLRSVVEASRVVGVPTAVVVAADACRDATAERAEAVLASAPDLRSAVLRTAHRAAGAARRDALDAALRLFDVPAAQVWLATTDADTVVHRSWLQSHLSWARSGVDGIAGLVQVDWTGHPLDLPTRYAESIASGGTALGHRHVHGANLGVLASRWLEVGGCGDAAVAEDHELWRRLQSVGAEVLGVDNLFVTTSGRLSGRSPLGFAHYLTHLAAHELEDIA